MYYNVKIWSCKVYFVVKYSLKGGEIPQTHG